MAIYSVPASTVSTAHSGWVHFTVEANNKIEAGELVEAMKFGVVNFDAINEVCNSVKDGE